MEKYKRFKVTTKHDNGKAVFRIMRQNKEQAIESVMSIENCPRCAIVSVRELKEFNIWKYDINKIASHWTKMCYYMDFSTFLREHYNIAESTYMKYKRLQERARA